jgi:uncharacterized protein YggE
MRNKKLLLSVGLVLVLVIVGLAGCSSGGINQREVIEEINVGTQQDGIWVSGTGKVTAVPDVAILSLGVEAQAITVAEAQAQAIEAMNAVMDALDNYGVALKDIKTQYYNIYPVRTWDDGNETLIGYRITNAVTVKIRQVENIGGIIDAVTVAGGDHTRISNISFAVDDQSAYKVEARDKAITDAKAKAEQLAELAGVTLGKPTYIAESDDYNPVLYRDFDLMEGSSTAATTSISPGEAEISLTVQMSYSIN